MHHTKNQENHNLDDKKKINMLMLMCIRCWKGFFFFLIFNQLSLKTLQQSITNFKTDFKNRIFQQRKKL